MNKGVDKGEPKTGTDSSDHIKASETKQLGQSSTIAPKKRTQPASKSPEEVQRPPLKRHNKSNTMAAPTTSTTTRKPVGFMQSCCFVFVGILSTYK